MLELDESECPDETISVVVCTLDDRDFELFVSLNRDWMSAVDQFIWVRQGPQLPLGHRTEVVEGASVEVVSCPVRGLSLARNLALSLVRSEWVYFLDDDAILHPNSIDALCEVLPGIGANVGLIVGRWVEKDRAFPRRAPITDPFRFARDRASIEVVYRARRLVAAGAFDVAFGRGALFSAAEEADATFRIVKSGATDIEIDSFRVSHPYAQRRTSEWLGPLRYEWSQSVAYGALMRKSGRTARVVVAGAFLDVARSLTRCSANDRKLALSRASGRVVGYVAYRLLALSQVS